MDTRDWVLFILHLAWGLMKMNPLAVCILMVLLLVIAAGVGWATRR
jgi:type III secretory pathway component EscR